MTDSEKAALNRLLQTHRFYEKQFAAAEEKLAHARTALRELLLTSSNEQIGYDLDICLSLYRDWFYARFQLREAKRQIKEYREKLREQETRKAINDKSSP